MTFRRSVDAMQASTPYVSLTLEAKWLMPAGTFAEDTAKDPKALFAARRTCFGRRPRLVDEYKPSNRRKFSAANFPAAFVAEMFQGEQRWESNALFRARSIGAGQAADGEFDAAAGEFPPGFYFRHIGRLRKFAKGGARCPRLALEGIGLAPPSALVGRRLRPRPFGETARDVAVFFVQRSFLSALITQKSAKHPIIAAKPATQNLIMGSEQVKAAPEASQSRRRPIL